MSASRRTERPVIAGILDAFGAIFLIGGSFTLFIAFADKKNDTDLAYSVALFVAAIFYLACAKALCLLAQIAKSAGSLCDRINQTNKALQWLVDNRRP